MLKKFRGGAKPKCEKVADLWKFHGKQFLFIYIVNIEGTNW